MTVRLQIIIGAALMVLLLLIIGAVRSGRLEFRFSMPWLLLLAVFLVMDIFPGVVEWIARVLGIKLPINMLSFCGVAISLALIFNLTTSVSRTSDRQKKLVQEVALLKKMLEETQRPPEHSGRNEKEDAAGKESGE